MTIDRRLFLLGFTAGPWVTAAAAQNTTGSTYTVEWSLGGERAPVTVIQYASITCHHCQNFHMKTWPHVKERYVDTGKIRFILRPFPLDSLAMAGFMLASCRGDVGGFKIIEQLYERGESWAHAANPGEALRAEAVKLGFSSGEFEACLTDQPRYEALLSVSRGGSIRGVASTPTFFINDNKKIGVLTIEQFSAVVDPLVK